MAREGRGKIGVRNLFVSRPVVPDTSPTAGHPKPISMSDNAVSRGVLIRDLMIFQVKLALDGLKDIALLQASLAAAVTDLVLMRYTRGRCFYGVLRLSERVDLWLNLHGPASAADGARDGLFGASRAGSPSFLGRLEELVRAREEEMVSPAERARRAA